MRIMSLVSQLVDPSLPTLHAIGFTGFGTVVIGIFGYIPIAIAVFAGLAGGVSYTLTIMRDPAIQTWFAKRKQRRQSNKILKLRAKQLIVNARIDALERMNAARAEAAEQVQVAKIVAAAELQDSKSILSN